MHIQDAVLTASTVGTAILATGWLGTIAGNAIALWRLEAERIPRVGLLSSVFFVVSLIQVPLAVTSVHLVLSGLLGLILGWAAFPAVLIGLALQWLFFGMGGITTLGINTVNMALPAVAVSYLFGPMARSRRASWVSLGGFLAGSSAILVGATLTALCIAAAGPEFHPISWVVFGTDAVLALGEGLLTAAAVVFLRRVSPEVLGASILTAPIALSRDT